MSGWILQIDTSGQRYRGQPEVRDCEVRFNLNEIAPAKILIDGAEIEPNGGNHVTWEYDGAARRTLVRFQLFQGVPVHVELQFR